MSTDIVSMPVVNNNTKLTARPVSFKPGHQLRNYCLVV